MKRRILTRSSVPGGHERTSGGTNSESTYAGDANVDGAINIDDYTRIDPNLSVGGSVKDGSTATST